MAPGDQIRVGGSGPPQIIDLERGEVRSPGAPPRKLSAQTLAAMRAAAAEMQAMGNQRVRIAQFMLGETQFEITLGGQTNTLAFIGDGRAMDEPMESVWRVATGRP